MWVLSFELNLYNVTAAVPIVFLFGSYYPPLSYIQLPPEILFQFSCNNLL